MTSILISTGSTFHSAQEDEGPFSEGASTVRHAWQYLLFYPGLTTTQLVTLDKPLTPHSSRIHSQDRATMAALLSSQRRDDADEHTLKTKCYVVTLDKY
jgi:hypothetical protein